MKTAIAIWWGVEYRLEFSNFVYYSKSLNGKLLPSVLQWYHRASQYKLYDVTAEHVLRITAVIRNCE